MPEPQSNSRPQGRKATSTQPRPSAQVVKLPGAAAPAPGQHPVPGSTTATRYTPGVGVWREHRQILGWCPTVTRHLVTYSTRGEVTSRRVTVAVGDATATVSTRDVADGSVWADRFPLAAGVAGREIRDTLTNIVDDQAARLPLTPLHPRWEDGRLVLPPVDVLPAGYGETAGSVADFAALLTAVADAPRLALIMGLAVGGLYVEPLGRQSYTVHLGGMSSVGKTTSAQVAASVFGDPTGIVKRWDVSANGLGAWLRDLACLPGFRDELGAAKFRVADLESVIFRAMEGAARDVSDREGRLRETRGRWHGALISTGNESIVERVANEGIAARVIELSGAVTASARQANQLQELIRTSYGHGLAAIVSRALAPSEFAKWATTAGDGLDMPDGGPGRRVAEHITLGVAGAQLLAELFKVPALADAAAVAAVDVLADQLAGIAERGSDPGERLLAAVAGAMASDPGMFPSRSDYERMLSDAVNIGRPAPRVWGWDLSADKVPGDVAIIQTRLAAITEPAGIEDASIALKELRTRKQLLADRAGKHLARLVKVGGKPRRAYVFTGVHPDGADTAQEPADPVAQEPADPVAQEPADPVAQEPAAPVAPEPDTLPGMSSPAQEPAAQVAQVAQEPAAPVAQVAQVAQEPGPAPVIPCPACLTAPGEFCGFGAVVDEHLPCVGCGRPTVVRSRCGVARTGYCHGPEHEQQYLAPAPASQPRHRPTQEPATAPAPVAPVVTPEEVADFARAVRKVTEQDVEPDTVRAAIDHWHTATGGMRFVGWAGDTGVSALAWLRSKRGADARGEGAARLDDPLVAQFGADALLHLDYIDHTQEPAPGQHVTALDINGQFLSAARIPLGTGAPLHVERPRSLTGMTKFPGYVRLASDVDCSHPAFRGRLTAGRVLVMPTADYLIKRGVDLDVEEMIVWLAGNNRAHLGTWGAHFSRAYYALTPLADTDPAAALALKVLKHVYTVTLGGWLRSEKNTTDAMRRDWSDHIIAESWVRALVSLDKAAGAGWHTVGMRRDSAWFLADTAPVEPAGLTTRTPEGEPTRQLGKWKVDRWAAVDADMIETHAAGSPDLFNRAVKAAHEARVASEGGQP